MRRLSSPALALAAALWAGAGAAVAQPPVWVVSDRDSQLVLFGSVHVLPPGLDWRPRALVQALQSAQDVWFELPVGPQTDAEVARLAASRGYLPVDQTLSRLMSPQGAARLARVCQTYGLAAPLLERFQPWMAEVVLAGAAYRAAGADAESGVEKALAAQAPPAAERRAFETAAEQMELFAGGSIAEQVASLEQSLEEMETDPASYRALVDAWMAADLAGLERDALDPMRKAAPALFTRMVTQRNIAWTRALDARLKGRGRTVVVVGVGHLVGAEGVPARLRALGYSVKGP